MLILWLTSFLRSDEMKFCRNVLLLGLGIAKLIYTYFKAAFLGQERAEFHIFRGTPKRENYSLELLKAPNT